MKERKPDTTYAVREAIPGANQHELMLELFRTIDDASVRVANAIHAIPDTDPIAKAINDLEARLETIEDALRTIHRAVREMGPV